MNKIIFFLILFSFASCTHEIKKPKPPNKSVTPIEKRQIGSNQWDKDIQQIREWVAQKGYDMKPTHQGIYYMIEREGVGVAHPEAGTTVTVNYKGTFLDGTQFDSSYDKGQPFTTKLSRVIQGWNIAIPLLKKGGKGKFVIPSNLAYGRKGRPTIPPNSILVFDIELIDFE